MSSEVASQMHESDAQNTAKEQAQIEFLRLQLKTTTDDYLEAGEIMQLTSILEIVYALAAAQGITSSELDCLRLERASQS